MPKTMSQGRAACRAAANGVANVETLGQILPQVVEAAAQQFLRHAQPYPPKGESPIDRPRLLGPMGMNGPPGPPPPRVPFPPDTDRHRAELQDTGLHDNHDNDTDRGDADDSES